jgi:hypothetical protein
MGDQMVDRDVIQELFGEIVRISSPDQPRWKREYFRNLYLFLKEACDDGFDVLASNY